MATDTKKQIRLIFPHQLFIQHFDADKSTHFILIEDDLLFRQYKFHKQKLILHRASMQSFLHDLKQRSFTADYIETSKSSPTMERLRILLEKSANAQVSYYDPVDDWLSQRLEEVCKTVTSKPERLSTPAFLTTPGQLDDYFENGSDRMEPFYEWQRKRLGILVENNKPVGGKWNFDASNRKKLPKSVAVPEPYHIPNSSFVDEAKDWVNTHFPDNPGEINYFNYPVTHADAKVRLDQFLNERLESFGPYEDSMSRDEGQLFHSVISPMINIGLLTPEYVVTETMKHFEVNDTRIESVEGFLRQIIGWREYVRAEYVRFGRHMRMQNHLGFTNTLPKTWLTGNVGIEPVDVVISRILKSAYAHHIERLMVLGNAMVLLRINPDEVYEWFMSLFIDAYDWVMVPNVYAMSQFAAGEKITTKPYVSGSNYIKKMSDFKDGEWAEIWDALFWTFVGDYRKIFENNYRSSMMVSLYDKQPDDKKQRHKKLADEWI